MNLETNLSQINLRSPEPLLSFNGQKKLVIFPTHLLYKHPTTGYNHLYNQQYPYNLSTIFLTKPYNICHQMLLNKVINIQHILVAIMHPVLVFGHID